MSTKATRLSGGSSVRCIYEHHQILKESLRFYCIRLTYSSLVYSALNTKFPRNIFSKNVQPKNIFRHRNSLSIIGGFLLYRTIRSKGGRGEIGLMQDEEEWSHGSRI
jgi:hypothetical protein